MRGDPSALEGLLLRYTASLYGLAFRLCGDPASSEDLVQETWLRFLRRPPVVLPGTTLLPWLRCVLVRLAIDESRKTLRRRTDASGLGSEARSELDRIDPAPSPDARMLADEEKSRVRAALGMLPMPERVVLILLHGEGLSVREVASALGITPSLVKNRALRGRRRLRTVLSGSDGADAKDPVRSPAT